MCVFFWGVEVFGSKGNITYRCVYRNRGKGLRILRLGLKPLPFSPFFPPQILMSHPTRKASVIPSEVYALKNVFLSPLSSLVLRCFFTEVQKKIKLNLCFKKIIYILITFQSYAYPNFSLSLSLSLALEFLEKRAVKIRTGISARLNRVGKIF